MTHYEYKVIPAPAKADKAKGIKTPEGRFAQTIETVMNRMAEGGWEFQRAELLPSEERSGLTGTTTTWRNLLVFRRPASVGAQAEEVVPTVAATPAPAPRIEAPDTAAQPAPAVVSEDEDPAPVVAIDELRAARAQVTDTRDDPPLTAELSTVSDAEPEDDTRR